MSFLPYIFEVFLCHFINIDKSSAKIAKGHIELSLAKEISSPWKELGLKLTKEEQQQKRAEAIQDLERQEQEKLKKNKGKRKTGILCCWLCEFLSVCIFLGNEYAFGVY